MFDLGLDGNNELYESFLLFISEVGSRLRILNDCKGIGCIGENTLNIIAEVIVVNEATCQLILLNECLDFNLGELYI